tara:strand:- start:158 stop:667 length:510 start_codon:yes stop_codon:yes gene_type:complete
MKGIVKRLRAITLAVCAITLISSDNPERLVIYDSCDYLEINNVYKINDETGEIKPRMVQYVWWEWRDSILTPVLDLNTRQRTGLSRRSSGFVVRDYLVVENNHLEKPRIIKTSISKTKKGWTCIYHDFTSDIMRHVSFKWIITTHTLYDSELNNREIITLEDRNRFTRR